MYIVLTNIYFLLDLSYLYMAYLTMQFGISFTNWDEHRTSSSRYVAFFFVFRRYIATSLAFFTGKLHGYGSHGPQKQSVHRFTVATMLVYQRVMFAIPILFISCVGFCLMNMFVCSMGKCENCCFRCNITFSVHLLDKTIVDVVRHRLSCMLPFHSTRIKHDISLFCWRSLFHKFFQSFHQTGCPYFHG